MLFPRRETVAATFYESDKPARQFRYALGLSLAQRLRRDQFAANPKGHGARQNEIEAFS